MKERLDILLVERRLVESRTKAQWLINNGYVSVNGIIITKPGKRVDNTEEIILEKEFPYVGRGGIKLEAALDLFSISVQNKTCADIGASIGGFTDCLLKNGAFKVYVVDTATDLLHPSLKCKPDKVIQFLGIDARKLKTLPEKVDLITIDITFASVREVLPNVRSLIKKNGDIIVLIKPLFETDFYESQKMIKESKKLKQILIDLMKWCTSNSLIPNGIIISPILGKGGSTEFFIHLKVGKNNQFNYRKIIENLFN